MSEEDREEGAPTNGSHVCAWFVYLLSQTHFELWSWGGAVSCQLIITGTHCPICTDDGGEVAWGFTQTGSQGYNNIPLDLAVKLYLLLIDKIRGWGCIHPL